MLEITSATDAKKFDITLTWAEWDKLRPTVSELSKKAQIRYNVHDFASNTKGEHVVLITCHATNEAEKAIDAELTKILGYVYA